MTTLIQIAIVIIVSPFLSCNTHSGDTNKIDTTFDKAKIGIKTSVLLDTPRSFVKNYGIEDSNPLFAFVGEKLLVEPLPSRQYSMDRSFIARYVILKKVYGDFHTDTIEFITYDHYGIPPFSTFKNALLFVTADSGIYYHQKYMYNDVYKTKDGRWAGTYAWEDFEHENNKKTKVKPVKIDFAEPVYYPTKMVNEQGDTLTRTLPRPYFRTIGDSAFAIYGNYVDDLFILKRDGYLTAREIFKNGKLKH